MGTPEHDGYIGSDFSNSKCQSLRKFNFTIYPDTEEEKKRSQMIEGFIHIVGAIAAWGLILFLVILAITHA